MASNPRTLVTNRLGVKQIGFTETIIRRVAIKFPVSNVKMCPDGKKVMPVESCNTFSLRYDNRYCKIL
jgi:hypothetical protein